uniref:Uncharacterized protein n=1 Tax=Meloidogyne floridensis TaxID=298350 RepID=A0A915NAK8_9BILA
ECQKLAEQKEYDDTHGDDENSSDFNSYSDLSESEIFIGKGGEGEQQNKDKTLSSKKGHKHNKNSRKNSKICLFPNAFAHRDLTPPELALGYSLRIFCREKNGPFSSYEYNKGITIITDEGELVEQQQRKQHIRYYVRGGRIYERSNNNNTPSIHQTKT